MKREKGDDSEYCEERYLHRRYCRVFFALLAGKDYL